MILIDKDIVKLNFDEDDVEHLKERLALAKNESGGLLTTYDNCAVPTSDTIWVGRAEYEHLKEQLALAREEIKSLKADAKEADRRADSLKTYYEGIISDYRKYADEADKRLEKALARIKSLNECLKKVVEMI